MKIVGMREDDIRIAHHEDLRRDSNMNDLEIVGIKEANAKKAHREENVKGSVT